MQILAFRNFPISRISAACFLYPLNTLLLVLLCACTTVPTKDELTRGPSPQLAPGAPENTVDGRERFRMLFCAALENRNSVDAEPVECDTWLHRIDDEPVATSDSNPTDSTQALEVIFVTGALSQCFGDVARPFGSAVAELAADGHRFHTIVVDGRSGTQTNAAEIALYVADLPVDAGMPRVLVGYSKGTSDILQFLVDYPIFADRIDAVVSVAGSVRGTPLAEHYEGAYELFVAHFPMGHCDAGDGELVHSLRSDVRTEWLSENPLPDHLRYYSVAAFTTQDFVARGLGHTWKGLLQHNRRNDGQLLPQDTLIPGSTVLGYVNADHWAVALDLESELEFIAHRRNPAAFPRTVLIEAILDFVSVDLR